MNRIPTTVTTHLVHVIVEPVWWHAVVPIPPRSPPVFETEADFAEVLAPDAVAIPSHNLDSFPTKGERVVDFDFEFRFSGGTVDGSGFSARDPNWVQRLAGSRSGRLYMQRIRSKLSGAISFPVQGKNRARSRNGTHTGGSVADNEVRVAESVLVLGDQVLSRMNLNDQSSERLVSFDERFEESIATLCRSSETRESLRTGCCGSRDLLETLYG